MTISTIGQLERQFQAWGASMLLIKFLSLNKTTKKPSLFGRFWCSKPLPNTRHFIFHQYKQKKTIVRRERIQSTLFSQFFLVGRFYCRHNAPSKAIDYFQYPELRFSDFLQGCKESPVCLAREGQSLWSENTNLEQQFVWGGLWQESYRLRITCSKFPSESAGDARVTVLLRHTIGLPRQTSSRDLPLQDLKMISGK